MDNLLGQGTIVTAQKTGFFVLTAAVTSFHTEVQPWCALRLCPLRPTQSGDNLQFCILQMPFNILF